MSWTLTPDQFALAWARTDGDRIPYPLAVRLSARDSAERAAQLPALEAWLTESLDADLEAALRVLARPELRVEVFGYRDRDSTSHPNARPRNGVRAAHSDELTYGLGTEPGLGWAEQVEPDPPGAAAQEPTGEPGSPVRVLGAAAGNVAVVAVQRPGATSDRGAEVRLFVGSPKSMTARLVSLLPQNRPGTIPRLSAPRAKVSEDSRDLVTMPVAGPTAPTKIRKLLRQPRDGIGQIVVSARRGNGEPRPFGVLCWIDLLDDGRYAVRTGNDVSVTPVDAEGFAEQLRPMVRAAGRTISRIEHG